MPTSRKLFRRIMVVPLAKLRDDYRSPEFAPNSSAAAFARGLSANRRIVGAAASDF